MRRKGRRNVIRLGRLTDVRKEINPGVLSAIGAISLTWNLIDESIDHALAYALDIAMPLPIDVTSRINGIDGKFAIIRNALHTLPFFAELRTPLVLNALSGVETHKKHRDGVIHARVHFPDEQVAETAHRRGIADEILISLPALNALYDLLALLRDEISAVAFLIHLARVRVADGQSKRLAEISRYDNSSSSRVGRAAKASGLTSIGLCSALWPGAPDIGKALDFRHLSGPNLPLAGCGVNDIIRNYVLTCPCGPHWS
jgi:hypothetical protein